MMTTKQIQREAKRLCMALVGYPLDIELAPYRHRWTVLAKYVLRRIASAHKRGFRDGRASINWVGIRERILPPLADMQESNRKLTKKKGTK